MGPAYTYTHTNSKRQTDKVRKLLRALHEFLEERRESSVYMSLCVYGCALVPIKCNVRCMAKYKYGILYGVGLPSEM